MTLDPKRLEAANLAYSDYMLEMIGMQKQPTVEVGVELAITAYLEVGDDWQPIETAPKDGTFVVICVSHETRDPVIGEARFLPATRFFEAEWWWQGCAPEQYINCEPISQTNFGKPTHWQPLPQPPKKGE